MNWRHPISFPKSAYQTLSTELFSVVIFANWKIPRQITVSHPATASYSPQNPHSETAGEKLSNPISHESARQRLGLRLPPAAFPTRTKSREIFFDANYTNFHELNSHSRQFA